MKRVMSFVVAILCLAGVAVAETDYVTKPVLSDIQRGVDNANQIRALRVLGAATIGGNVLASGEVRIDGKYAAVGPNATAGLMLQTGTNAISTITVVTNTFTVAFGAAPKVFCQALTAVSTNIVVTSASTTGFVCTAPEGTAFQYLAVGTRP